MSVPFAYVPTATVRPRPLALGIGFATDEALCKARLIWPYMASLHRFQCNLPKKKYLDIEFVFQFVWQHVSERVGNEARALRAAESRAEVLTEVQTRVQWYITLTFVGIRVSKMLCSM